MELAPRSPCVVDGGAGTAMLDVDLESSFAAELQIIRSYFFPGLATYRLKGIDTRQRSMLTPLLPITFHM